MTMIFVMMIPLYMMIAAHTAYLDDDDDNLDDEDCIVHGNMTVTHSNPNHHNIFPPGGNTAGGNLLGNLRRKVAWLCIKPRLVWIWARGYQQCSLTITNALIVRSRNANYTKDESSKVELIHPSCSLLPTCIDRSRPSHHRQHHLLYQRSCLLAYSKSHIKCKDGKHIATNVLCAWSTIAWLWFSGLQPAPSGLSTLFS